MSLLLNFLKLVVVDISINCIGRVGFMVWRIPVIINPVAFVLYTVAYVLRNYIRVNGIYADTEHVMRDHRPILRPLWFLLDDSIHIENEGLDYNTVDVNPNGGGAVPRAKTRLGHYIKSLSWSACRNCMVNYRNWNRKGQLLEPHPDPTKTKTVFGMFLRADGNKHIFMDIRIKGVRLFQWGWTLGDGRLESIGR